MGKFCEYCGTQLEENLKCTCAGSLESKGTAVEKKVEPEIMPQDLNTMTHARKETSTIVNPESIKKTYGGIKLTIKKFIQNPILTASNSEMIEKNTAWTLLGVQVLAVVVLMLSIYSTIKSKFWYGDMFFDERIDFMSEIMPSIVIMSILEIAVLFVCLLGMLKFFKSDKKTMQIISSIAIASIPCTTMMVCMSIFVFLFGVSTVGLSILGTLIIFAMVSSICILERGLYDDKISSLNNLLVVSIACAVHFILYIFIAMQINEDFIHMILNILSF